MNNDQPLTWNELGDWYDKNIGGSRRARTLPMEAVLNACLRTGKFVVDKDDNIRLKSESTKPS